MQVFAGAPGQGMSDDIEVVENCYFSAFNCYIFGTFSDKVSVII